MNLATSIAARPSAVRLVWALAAGGCTALFPVAAAHALDASVGSLADVVDGDGRGPGQVVGWAPLDLIANHLRLTYERRVGPAWSLAVSPKVGLSALNPAAAHSWPLGGDSLGLELGARRYLAAHALRGIFFEPRLSYTHGFVFGRDRVAAHAHVGRQWLSASGWSLLASLGLRYHNDFNRRGSQQASAVYTRDFDAVRGFVPELNLTLGRAF